MRWFFDERLGKKRQVIRARPIWFESGQKGVRVELNVEEGCVGDLNKPLVISEAEYNAKRSNLHTT